MKKTITSALLISTFVLCLLNPGFNQVSAQESEYYHVGDTIVGRSPIYFYQWWNDTWLSDTSHRLDFWWQHYTFYCNSGSSNGYWVLQPHGEFLMKFFTETPLKIIGIATTSRVIWPGTYEPYWPEYMRLYEANETDFYLLKEVQFVANHPLRYMKTEYRKQPTGKCCYDSAINYVQYPEIREFYFDKPVTVTDSFYLGYTTESWWNTVPPNFELTIQGSEFHESFMTRNLFLDSLSSDSCLYACEPIPNMLYKYRHIEYDIDTASPNYGDTIDASWHWTHWPHVMLEFPIIVIDSSYIITHTCPPVENLHVSHYGEHNAVLLWNSQEGQQSYQLSYGPAGTPPDSGTVIAAPINAYNLQGLDTGVNYTAYVRAICQHDSLYYSDWSAPVDILITDTSTHDVGILPVAADDGIMLRPNPASGEVTVEAAVPMEWIEVYSVSGLLVMRRETGSAAATLDISALPAGEYLVRIRTAITIHSKRLAVK